MISTSDYAFFSRFLKQKSGLVLDDDKHYLLESRLTPLMRKFAIPNFAALMAQLRNGASTSVVGAVVEAMTTNETLFFRDRAPFNGFVRTMLPALHAARPSGARLRIWCAAASSGQEPYSLAIMLAENRGVIGRRGVEILATDLSNDMLDRARAGRYSQFEVRRGLGEQLLEKYFTKMGDLWEVKPSIREMVHFRMLNLLDAYTSLGTFDIVFCRNVLIYFDADTKVDILARLARAIAPDGYLVLGAAESVIGLAPRFKVLAGHSCTYVPRQAG